eukprot:scaffold99490_cov35-Tisochrysis_lutea.AAC.2
MIEASVRHKQPMNGLDFMQKPRAARARIPYCRISSRPLLLTMWVNMCEQQARARRLGFFTSR